ncbi:type II secretion system F family protein [Candidatus Uhrbacteria bacterium]|nr:type II secretion system F family protein [Candidatus Uhrbacteria bacterium]
MTTFKYRARMSDGRMSAGLIETTSFEEAKQALEERNMEVLLLEENKGFAAAEERAIPFLNHISAKDLVIVTRTISTMVSASVPLADALKNISRQSDNIRLKRVLIDLANEVEGGARFSDALEKHTDIFSGFFINMVRSGETTGQLGDVLEYLADQQEKDYDLTSKIKGAMIYPAFILGTMAVMSFIMMTFVVPKLVAVLSTANIELPWTTRTLIVVSGFMSSYWWLILLMVIAIFIGYRVWSITPAGKFSIDRFKIYVPGFGAMFRQVYAVRFARSLSTLTKGGVDMVNALEIVSSVIGNELWKQAVHETIREVNDGNSIVTAFQRYKFIPTLMTQMMSVGEATGRTQEILARISSFYSREIDNQVANLTKLIEPIVLIILGLGVGVLVSAILLPLYSLSSGTGV